MDLASIITTLTEKGYNAVAHDVIENGITKHGISILETHSSPCIYVEDLMQLNPSIEKEDLATQIINIYNSKKTIGWPSVPMYIVTNQNPLHGAPHAISSSVKDWACEMGISRLIVLPSSSHEVILLPVDNEELDMEYLSEFVSEGDNTQILPEEKLADRAYLLHIGVD